MGVPSIPTPVLSGANLYPWCRQGLPGIMKNGHFIPTPGLGRRCWEQWGDEVMPPAQGGAYLWLSDPILLLGPHWGITWWVWATSGLEELRVVKPPGAGGEPPG